MKFYKLIHNIRNITMLGRNKVTLLCYIETQWHYYVTLKHSDITMYVVKQVTTDCYKNRFIKKMSWISKVIFK